MHAGALHSLTWLVWAISAAAVLELTSNPVYVGAVLAVAALTVEAHGRPGPLRRAFPLLVTLGVIFALVRVVLTGLTTHGVGDALFRLPEATLPALLGGFTVGGTVETPVLAQAAVEGFVIVGIMAVFGAFNGVVSHHELLQAAPRAFYEPGLVVTVALAFVPATITAIGRVREADRARTGGSAVRRGRLLRTIVPVLESGMERALLLAESMDSRGLGHGRPSRAAVVSGWLGAAGLVALAAAFLALVGRAGAVALIAVAAALGLMTASIVAGSRASSRTRHRRRPFTRTDATVAATSVAAPVIVAVAGGGTPALTWAASSLTIPPVSASTLLAVLLLALPAVLPGPAAAVPRPEASALAGSRP